MTEEQGKSPEQLAAADRLFETTRNVEEAERHLKASPRGGAQRVDLAEAYVKAIDEHVAAVEAVEHSA